MSQGGILLVRQSGPTLSRNVETILLAQGAAFDLSGDIALNTAHRQGDGSDHADVVSNNAHRAATGNPHGTEHNETDNKQGGAVDEFYHTTADQNGAIVNAPTAPTAANPFITVGDQIDNDALLFMMRVIAAGGTVEDVAFLDSFLKDAKYNTIFPYFDDIVFAGCPSWGIKGTSTASMLFSITGAEFDLPQVLGSSQPAINLADLNGRTRLLFDGVDDVLGPTAFALSQPETIILCGAEQESRNTGDRFFDGNTAISGTMYQIGAVSPDITIFAGNNSGTNSDWGINTPAHVRGLISGNDTTTQIDNNAAAAGVNAGAADMGGFTLGGSPAANFGHLSVGLPIVLNSPVDANYAAKMTAIYNFSKNAYGTP